MLHDAIQSFVREDIDLARRTAAIEDRIDSLRNEINAELRQLERDGRVPFEAFTPLASLLERLPDDVSRESGEKPHVGGRIVHAGKTGQPVEHRPVRGRYRRPVGHHRRRNRTVVNVIYGQSITPLLRDGSHQRALPEYAARLLSYLTTAT